ncbi:hypothetical protein MERGE_003048 [Pneumocystis wakefieldiae]|uniref:Homeobox domain-containing protein n=1 Tax=Pneumocystis wakefieldiae TaxID=38082 RepID=A0A899FVU3_9ASCO|nr:hypothetical protein MERGE_003048 [Pneumocystis wakefieldiae]
MPLPLNTAEKDFSFVCEYGRKPFEVERTNDLLKCTVLQMPRASQDMEQHESTLSVSTPGTPIEIREPLRQKRRRRRTTPQELAILEDEIAAKINSIVSGEDRMGSREIQIWFQNKRQAMRRQTLHFALSNDHTDTVSGSQATKKSGQWDMDNSRFQQQLEHQISSFKKVPSLCLRTNEGGKAQVMFNVLRDNKNTFPLYKKDDERDGKCMPYYTGKENVPPSDFEKSIKKEVGENEIEACARSLVGLAQGW